MLPILASPNIWQTPYIIEHALHIMLTLLYIYGGIQSRPYTSDMLNQLAVSVDVF